MKIVLISDTHGLHEQLVVPDGDIIIHAGDFSRMGRRREIKKFVKWYTALPHRYKVFIAGNHDFLAEQDPETFRSLIDEELIYLENEAVTIEGIKIWGSPITPFFLDWAFNRERGTEIDAYWQNIPDDVDLLVTHGPPKGFGDRTVRGEQVGCADLLSHFGRIQPRYHVFGHIHEGFGRYLHQGINFINASQVDEHYRLVHKPIMIEW